MFGAFRNPAVQKDLENAAQLRPRIHISLGKLEGDMQPYKLRPP